jgi:protein-tyrosine phosphatase
MGNICRSPMAETIFQYQVAQRNLSFLTDSAGTSGYHQGEKADLRMRQAAKNHGYEITSLSRKFLQEDFDRFDYIVVMDDRNYFDIHKLALKPDDEKKILKMAQFFAHNRFDHVPDPYYGNSSGFDTVIELLEESVENLIRFLLDGNWKL